MEYKVVFSDSAKKDLFEIYYYIAINDSFDIADRLKVLLMKRCLTLSKNPKRGMKVKELQDERPYLLKLIIKPYIVFYKIKKKVVIVVSIIDGRRDFQSVLIEKFLN